MDVSMAGKLNPTSRVFGFSAAINPEVGQGNAPIVSPDFLCRSQMLMCVLPHTYMHAIDGKILTSARTNTYNKLKKRLKFWSLPLDYQSAP